MTTRRCGSCRFWRRIDKAAGNCWPVMPFWHYGQLGCATWETEGGDCDAWSLKDNHDPPSEDHQR
jgi:hypothetical protein